MAVIILGGQVLKMHGFCKFHPTPAKQRFHAVPCNAKQHNNLENELKTLPGNHLLQKE